MAWYKHDDEFLDDPRHVALGDRPEVYAAAVALWLGIVTYVAREESDGRISRMTALRRVSYLDERSAKRGLEALLDVGFVATIAGSETELEVVGWCDEQRTHEQWERDRARGRDRKENFNARNRSRRAQRNGSPNDVGNAVPNGVPNGVGNSSGTNGPDSYLPSVDYPLPPTGCGEGTGPGPSADRPDAAFVPPGPNSTERFLGAFEPAEDLKLQSEIARSFDRAWKRHNGVSLGIAARATRERERLGSLLAWARDVDPNDPVGVVERAAFAFASSPDSKGDRANAPFAKFCAQPGRYATSPSSEDQIERQRLRDSLRAQLQAAAREAEEHPTPEVRRVARVRRDALREQLERLDQEAA